MRIKSALLITALIVSYSLLGQKTTPTIKEESEVPQYVLPQLLKTKKGKSVKTVRDWERSRRPEIHDYFAHQVYGVVPAELNYHKAELMDYEPAALGGTAVRKQVNLHFKNLVLLFTEYFTNNIPIHYRIGFSSGRKISD